ncbi:hypothetical protein Bca52824_038711 [Brassica carinata]|uniref:Uncharacterized protein n=1 Tax=Brassica carinata TaxID=52824 RepID=A0A8X7RQ52_BRACI|nr:hypothetical protein Bca52824_038711 [Brassica carinata]
MSLFPQGKPLEEGEIEDPRALYQAHCGSIPSCSRVPALVAYTTSRISAARFPDTYNASFQDPIPAENLETSGDSVVSISTVSAF